VRRESNTHALWFDATPRVVWSVFDRAPDTSGSGNSDGDRCKMTIAFVRPTLTGGLLALVGALAGCNSPTALAPSAATATPTDVTLSVVSGNAQSGPADAQLPNPIRVRVLNGTGAPMSNFAISFVVTSGGGSVFAPAVMTNASGYADELWTLGPRLGPQTLAARSVSSTGVAETYGTFTATGLPPNVLVAGSNSTGIILMNANGSNVQQVLTTGAQDYSPNLSPDHRKIVFFSSRVADSTSVFLMNANGTNVHKIGPALYWSSGPPQWSPNDSLIVFAGQPTGAPDITPGTPADCCTPGILTIDTVGTLLSAEYFVDDEAGPAAWTANGQGVLFFCDDLCFGGSGLFLEASDQQVLGSQRDPWDVNAIAASPDGQHIAFVGKPEGTAQQTYLYTMHTDGTNIAALTSATGLGNQLSYSPDGTVIAVDHGFINADGTDYQVVKGCPCSFAPTPTTFSGALARVFRVRRHMQWFQLR
jgi:hypothetical protein